MYEPFQYEQYELKVMVDDEEADAIVTQEEDKLIITFPCRSGKHDVVVYHVVQQGEGD